MPRPTPSQPTGPTGPSTSDRRAQQWEEAENERKKKEQEQKELQDKIREANKRAAERRKADDDKRRVEANQRKTDAQNRQRQPAREPQQLPPPPDEREVEAARDAVRMAWLKAVESKIRARETPAAAGRNAMDAFLEPLEKIVRRGIGLLPWVRYSEMGLTLSVNTQAHRAHMEVAQDREPNNVDASRLRSVHTGIGLPELDKRYRVDFPYYLAPEPVSILTGPRPYLDPWIKVPVGGTWLYYQDGATLHRVDWPPALPPATPTWSNHLSHAVPMLTSTGPHGTTSYNGLYLGPITPKAGLSIFFQTGSWYGATNFCTLLTNPEPSATRASLDHAAVEGAPPDGPKETDYPESEHVWLGSSNHGTALVGVHYLEHDYTWPVKHTLEDDVPVHLFSLFCGPFALKQEYPQYRCTERIEDAPLVAHPAPGQEANPAITCIPDTLQLVYSPDAGVSNVVVATFPSYAITRYNTKIPLIDSCSPICLAGDCFLGFLTCTAWSPCRPTECEWGYNFIGTGILNSGPTLGYTVQWGVGAWTWHEVSPAFPNGQDFNIWLTATYDGRPPNPLLIDATVRPPINPPGEQSWNTPAYYQLHASYGAAAPSDATIAGPNLGKGFDITQVITTCGMGLSGDTLYAYFAFRIGEGVQQNPIVYRGTANRSPGAAPGQLGGWKECPISGVWAVTQDGQGVVGWYQKANTRGLFWKYTVDAGETWLDFPLPPSFHDYPNGGLVDA